MGDGVETKFTFYARAIFTGERFDFFLWYFSLIETKGSAFERKGREKKHTHKKQFIDNWFCSCGNCHARYWKPQPFNILTYKNNTKSDSLMTPIY